MAEKDGATAPASTLKDIFGATPGTPEPASSSAAEKEEDEKDVDAADEPEKKEPEKKDPPSDKKVEGDKKVPATDKKDEPDPKDKPKDKEKEKESDDKSKEKKEDKPSEKKAEEDKKWDTEDNPFVKRLKDTHAWGNTEHQKALQLESQAKQLASENEVLKKKVAGTWTEEDEKAHEVTPEQIATTSLNVGKALASRNAAYKIVGEEKTNAVLSEFYKVFGEDELIQSVVMRDESPVLRAFDIMNRYHFEQKYGDNPNTIHESITKEVKEKYAKELRDEITKELLEGVEKKKKQSPLSSGAGDNGVAKDKGEGAPKQTPLKEIFDHKK